MKVQVLEQNFYLDGYLKSALDLVKENIKKDLDFVFIVDGHEGSGKSVLAMQCAKYVDENFSIDEVCFNPREFLKKVIEAKKYQSIIFDEAITGMSARESIFMVNRTLMKTMAQIRQKNLFVQICIPSFFDLDRNIALWRSRVLLHTYFGEKFRRGRFMFYNIDKKISLYQEGKPRYSYYVKPNFIGSFTNYYTINEEEYRKRKFEALAKNIGRKENINKYKAQRNLLMQMLAESGKTHEWIAKQLEQKGTLVSRQTVDRAINNPFEDDFLGEVEKE